MPTRTTHATDHTATPVYFLAHIVSIVLVALTCLSTHVHAQQATLLFMGDAMQHASQLKAAQTGKNQWNYDSCYLHLYPIIAKVDMAVVNLEVPLAAPPYAGYPAFSAPASYASALQKAGIQVMVTANNHACDKGLRGIRGTVHTLDSLQMEHTGIFRDSAERAARYPLLLVRNGITMAMLNYTYGTNGIAIPSPAIVNLIDTVQIKADIAKAQAMQPDIIIACVHWGVEYALKPHPEQKTLARLLHRQGVRLVIGSHPHVVQPMLLTPTDSATPSQLTVYSLGNFISNQRQENTDGGAMVQVHLSKQGQTIHIDSAGYLLTWVHAYKDHNRTQFRVLPISQWAQDTAYWKTDSSALKKMNYFYTNITTFLNKNNQGVAEWQYHSAQNKWILYRND